MFKFLRWSLIIFITQNIRTHLHCYTYNVSADMSFGLLQVLSHCKYSFLFLPVVLSEIIRRSNVQSQLQVRITMNTYYYLTLETPEEGQRTYWPKRYEYNNKDELNNPNILRYKNKWHHTTNYLWHYVKA